MGTHPIFESDFDCLTDNMGRDRGPRRNKSLFVRNIADDIDQDELHREFSRYGSIKDVYVPRDYYNKRPRGFAYVQFADIHYAEDAQEGMDGRKVCGRFIDVQFAKGDRKSPGSMRIRDPRGGSSRDRRRSRSRSRDRRRRRRSRSDSRESPRRRRRTRSRSKSRRKHKDVRVQTRVDVKSQEREDDHDRDLEYVDQKEDPLLQSLVPSLVPSLVRRLVQSPVCDRNHQKKKNRSDRILALLRKDENPPVLDLDQQV